MNLYFANPFGWLCAGAILPLIYLHFFRRQTRKSIVNTLFLVEKSATNREAGDLRDRWRQSASFWLQVFVLLLASWLLSQPRWANSQSVGKVAFVLDSSASMSAFREKALAGIREAGELMEQRLSATEFVLLESGSYESPLYRGRNLDELIGSLDKWKPRSGSHSALARLSDARSFVGVDGFVLFVSDRETTEISGNALPLLVGDPFENVGVAGARSLRREDRNYWRAIVRNYGVESTRREWWLEFEGGRSPRKSIELESGMSIVLEGLFPEGEDSVALALSEDGFSLDDYAPIVVEKPKALSVAFSGADSYASLFERLARSVDNCRISGVGENADLVFESAAGLDTIDVRLPGICIVEGPTEAEGRIDLSANVPSNHSLNAGLSWDGFVLRGRERIGNSDPADEVLLWKGEGAIIFIRDQRLVFDFRVQNSNLERMPAFALLVGRYLENLRRKKPTVESINCDTGQTLEVAYPNRAVGVEIFESHGDRIESRAVDARMAVTAPVDPGFFRVEQASQPLVIGAARFSDVRESDFRMSRSEFDLEEFDEKLVDEYYDDDFHSSAWLLCLGGAMLAGWFACFRENL